MKKLRQWGALLGAALLLTGCGTGPAEESGTMGETQTPTPAVSASPLPSNSSDPSGALPTPDEATPAPSPEATPKATPEPTHQQAVYPEGAVKLEGAERERYMEMAKDVVSVQITQPETAVFSEEEDEWAVFRAEEHVEVSSWVDGEDTAGKTVHSTFTVQFQDGDIAYMRIDDVESGTKLG